MQIKALYISSGHDFVGRHGKGRLDHGSRRVVGIRAADDPEAVGVEPHLGLDRQASPPGRAHVAPGSRLDRVGSSDGGVPELEVGELSPALPGRRTEAP